MRAVLGSWSRSARGVAVATVVTLAAGVVVVVPLSSTAAAQPTALEPRTDPLVVPSSTRPPGKFPLDEVSGPVKLVRELVDQRTTRTSTWTTSTGSIAVRQYAEPHFYRPSPDAPFVPIDLSLVTDDGGRWRTAASPTPVTFGPLQGDASRRILLGEQAIDIRPLGTEETRRPEVEDRTVTYADLWPGVDLVETVGHGVVQTDIVIKRRGTRSTFPFAVAGATAHERGDSTELRVGGRALADVPEPSVSTARTPMRPHRPGRAAPGLALAPDSQVTASGERLEVAVDRAALSALPDSAFPVSVSSIVDYGPFAPKRAISYSTSGATASQVQVGFDSSGKLWRGAAYFSTPAAPAPGVGQPAYQLTSAHLSGSCSPACTVVPNRTLQQLHVRGASNPEAVTPTFASIPTGDLLGTFVGIGIGAEITSWWRGRAGAWLGFDGNTSGINNAAGRWARFPALRS